MSIGHGLKGHLHLILDWDEVSDEERAVILHGQTELWNSVLCQSDVIQSHQGAFDSVVDALMVYYAELKNIHNSSLDAVMDRVKKSETAKGFAYLLWLKFEMVKYMEDEKDADVLLFDIHDLNVTLDIMAHVISMILPSIDITEWNISFNKMLAVLHDPDIYHFGEALKYLRLEDK